jgi:hypothetical protein
VLRGHRLITPATASSPRQQSYGGTAGWSPRSGPTRTASAAHRSTRRSPR